MEEQRIPTGIPRQWELQGQFLVMWVRKTRGAVTSERERQQRKICIPEPCSNAAAKEVSTVSVNNDCKDWVTVLPSQVLRNSPFCWGPWSNPTVIYTGFISGLDCNVIKYPCTKPSAWRKHSSLSLKGHVNQKRFLKGGRKQMSLFKAVVFLSIICKKGKK